jgi:D-alanyl-D-alanine carboxypeptidase/D-alanyl-D-alanine-endopeptidase (penicillin-binding protein 4)
LPVLRSDLEKLLADPVLDRASWAVLVQSLDTGEVLYSFNALKLMMPASNMKILTLATATERLGWDYQFETHVLATGDVDHDGLLHGDLIIRGSGDPTIGCRSPEQRRAFESWTEEIRKAGIRSIAGRIVGDDHAFDNETLGAGWAWDYLGYGYAAPISALPYNDDTVDIAIRAGRAQGQPVEIDSRPADSSLVVVNHLTTAAEGSVADVGLHRIPTSPVVEVTGTVPAGAPEIIETASVDNPTDFFARAFRQALITHGIPVTGEAVDIDAAMPPPDQNQRVVVSHKSPPLKDIGTTLMKVSQNLYAEILLRTMASQNGVGTVEAGRRIATEILAGWGVGSDSFVMYDGSGLSRYNYVTTDSLVRILRHLYEDPRHRDNFMATLPVGGRDGSLANRFKGTRAEGMVQAKTGSIANVRSLSGYVKTADGEPLVFSMIVNHFTASQSTIDALTDRVVSRLAEFTRR